MVVPSQPPASILADPSSPIPPADLGSRLYLAIRPASDSEDGEKSRDAQERLVREVWRRVEKLDYVRPQ